MPKRQSNIIPELPSFSREDLIKIESILKESYSVDTCYPASRKDWTEFNPSLGQCAITSLVIQDILDGEILFDEKNNHFWNMVEGLDLDLTREQFSEGVNIRATNICVREELLYGPHAERAETLQRYNLLKDRVRNRANSIKLRLPEPLGVNSKIYAN